MQQALQQLRYRIDSEIEIEATPEQVWRVFGDFADWHNWSDFMVLEKLPELGKRCKVVFHLDSGCMKQSPHDPEILVLEENKELRWRDYRGPIISQFFRGSHWWIVERLPNGHTRFLHGAEMFGLALPFVQSSMHATRRGYHVWNKALREEVLARLQQDKLLAAEELHEVFAAPKAHPVMTREQQQQQQTPKQSPQQHGHKLQAHKSGKKVWRRGLSGKRAAGRPVVTVLAGGEVNEVGAVSPQGQAMTSP